MIRAWWHYSENYGDRLTPYIISKLTGHTVTYCDPGIDNDDLYMVTGSILGTNGARNCIIWGNGISYATEPIFRARRWAAVRGPLSAKRVIDAGLLRLRRLAILLLFYRCYIIQKLKNNISWDLFHHVLIIIWLRLGLLIQL